MAKAVWPVLGVIALLVVLSFLPGAREAVWFLLGVLALLVVLFFI